MKKTLPALFLMCTLGSCVTMFNRPSTTINVRVPKNAKVVYTNERGSSDSVAPDVNNMARLIVRRSDKLLPLTVLSDTGSFTFQVEPVLSSLFYANLYGFYGIGFLVDHNNMNRFTYPHFIYPDPRPDAKRGYKINAPLLKSDWEISFTPPFVNGFVFNPARMSPRGGVLGIGLGTAYHYSDKRFWWGELGTAASGGMGDGYRRIDSIPANSRLRLTGWYLNMRHHHQLGRLDLGYGLSTGERRGREFYDTYLGATYKGDSVVRRFSHVTTGLSFSANYRIATSFYAGISYQPQMFEISKKNTGFSYSHMTVFGFSWRLGLRRFR